MSQLGFSSDIYHIKIEELLALNDATLAPSAYIYHDPFILLIGKESKNIPDLLGCGRDILLEAQKQGLSHYPTRIVFEQRAPQLSVLGLLKPIRKKYQDASFQSYEIRLSDIIDNHLERNLKTEETAYNYSERNKWGVPKDQRQDRFNKIDQSFRDHGYDKNHPMENMI